MLLTANTTYTATVSTDATTMAGLALENAKTWSFKTIEAPGSGQQAVDLGSAVDYVILSKSGISTTGTTAIVGDIGVSPAAEPAITGFDLVSPWSTFATSALIEGKVWSVSFDEPTPTNLGVAVLDMEHAYDDAAGRTLPDSTELGDGDINGMTLTPGLHKWGTGVSFANGVTLDGGANDVFIFQIAQNLTVGNGAMVTLAGNVKAENVFWQVAGEVTLGTTADFKGILLSKTLIAMETGAKLLGRAYAQTAVTLDANAVTQP
ncbi:MAG: DUF3494 domain-containing protein [Bradymonadaceae bacterium]|nr:DUF3494 domain-containing protein [Lujinxingiaceae bacterium]